MNFKKNIYREIIGIILLFLIAFSSMSLFTYNPNDLSIIQQNKSGTEISNLFGMSGAIFSGIFIFYFGIGSFWLPIILAIITVDFFRKQIKIITLSSTIIGGIILISVTGSLVSLIQTKHSIFWQKIPINGLSSMYLKRIAILYFNKVGGSILLSLIWFVSFIITTRLSTSSILNSLKLLTLFIIYNPTITAIKYIKSKDEYTKKKESMEIIVSQPSKKNKTTSKDSTKSKKNITPKVEYNMPKLDLLDNPAYNFCSQNTENYTKQSTLLIEKLRNFGINGEITAVKPGPVITIFEYKPDPGVKISKILNLSKDISLALQTADIRIIAPIPGKSVIGIEIPNLHREPVKFKEIISSKIFLNSNSKLTLCLGKNTIGNPVSTGLEKMPHLLIAGATGTGKSVALNVMICSLLYKLKPEEIKFIMIDPKRIELSAYDGIPHLIAPVVTDMKKATGILSWTVKEMQHRYELFSEKKVKNIEQYNKNIQGLEIKKDMAKKLPYIVIVIDELSDLMIQNSRNVENSLTRLAQMARAAGIHLILATQRPSVDVLTGIIKANFPTRLTFKVSSKIDSRTIIDNNGAENLLGDGDMLFIPPGTAKIQRIHGAYISERELSKIIEFIKKQRLPKYDETLIKIRKESDIHYHDAVALVTKTKKASVSMIQKHFRISYNRASKIMKMMEKEGVLGTIQGAKHRKISVEPHNELS